MKNIKLILASFCLVLVGCSDDDDDSVVSPSTADVCADFTVEADCAASTDCEWHADDSMCEDVADHDDHAHCEDYLTESDCGMHSECEWHADDNACEDADDHADCEDADDHADVDGFVLERDGVEIYRQFQGAVTGDVTIDVGEMVDIAVHFLDENETVIEGGYTSECYGLEFEIADPSIISIELEDHDHEEAHCDDLTNQADCDASDECEWHADDSMCEEVGHEDGEHDDEDHYEFELTGLVENYTTFQMSIMHAGHADYTSMDVLVTVIPSPANFVSENPLDN
ncbi:MAG: hypothetical protein CMG07_05110 [Candidatus Marinimicrobia bacterium]|nr:hypothetical protein [Candidatus Neomarinimicrobiota bacterium]